MYATTITETWLDYITRPLVIQCNHLTVEIKTTANGIVNKYKHCCTYMHLEMPRRQTCRTNFLVLLYQNLPRLSLVLPAQ